MVFRYKYGEEKRVNILVELKEIDRALAEILLDNIQKKQGNPTYKEIAEKLSERLKRDINPHYGLANPLGIVSTLCCELGLPLISARVIYSGATNAKTVGEGFYPLACELKPEYKTLEPEEAWKRELKLIRECNDWDRLQQYLDGTNVEPQTARPTAPTVSNPFIEWLSQNTTLAESSINKYYGAVGTISREMYSKGVIQKPFENMSLFELDIAISSTMDDSDFIEKNTRGNHMYSNALKQYRYFIHATCEQTEDTKYIDDIKTDSSISQTERTSIIQSRVGQGVFRKQLMKKYGGSCIITGINHPNLLVASHIKPWAASSNDERLSVDNGLLLSATYDRLFDSGLITFNESGKIYLSSFIGSQNISRLNLNKDMHFNLQVSGKMAEYLEYHRDVLFIK